LETWSLFWVGLSGLLHKTKKIMSVVFMNSSSLRLSQEREFCVLPSGYHMIDRRRVCWKKKLMWQSEGSRLDHINLSLGSVVLSKFLPFFGSQFLLLQIGTFKPDNVNFIVQQVVIEYLLYTRHCAKYYRCIRQPGSSDL
jgi:hypothetical protein